MISQPPDGFADDNGPPDGFDDQSEPSFLGNVGKGLKGLYDVGSRVGQGIMDLPKDTYQTGKDVMQGNPISQTPLAEDAKTVGGAAWNMSPKIFNQGGSYKLEPGGLYRQYESLAAEPFKHVPGNVGEQFKKAYPGNPYYDQPVESMLALAPLAKPLLGAARVIPGVDEGLNTAESGMRENLVAPNARRALGKFPTNMPTEEANQVGLTALDQGVIKNPLTHPFSSGREGMLERAGAINDSIGEHIGSFLKGQGESLDADRAMAELDKVKEQFYNDPDIVSKVEHAKDLLKTNSTGAVQSPLQVAIKLRGKTYVGNPGEIHADLINRMAKETGENPDTLIDAIDKIGDQGFSQNGKFLTRDEVRSMTNERPEAASLLASGKMKREAPLSGPFGPQRSSPLPNKMDFTKANQLKSYLQKKVNYNSDAATGDAGKAIARNLRGSIDTQLDEFNSKLRNREGMGQFKSDKSMFGKTRTMQDVLEKQTNRDARNMPISLPSVGVGIGGFMKGGPTGGLAALGAEWVKRYGNAAAANMMNDVSKAIGGLGEDTSVSPALKAAPILGQGKKTLDESVIAKYMQSNDNDPKKAAQAAEVDGYSW